MANQYSDVFKGIDDFFKKTFSFGHTVEAKAKSESGVKLTATAKLDDGTVDTKLKAEANVFGGLSVDKFEVSTLKQACDLDLSYEDNAVVPDTKVTFKFHDNARDQPGVPSGKMAFKHAHPHFALEGEADLTAATGNVAVTTMYKGVTLGAKVGLDTGLAGGNGGFDLTSYDGLASITKGDTQVALRTANKCANVEVGFQTKAGGATVVAKAAAPCPCACNAGEAKGVSVSAGFKKALDNGATFAAAVDSKGNAQLGYTLAVGANTKFATAATIDLAGSGAAAHNFGTKFTVDF